jgi:hypothetical protein
VYPLVAGGGDFIQVWKLAAFVLNKQSRTAEKVWSSGLELGGIATPNHEASAWLMLHRVSELDGFFRTT